MLHQAAEGGRRALLLSELLVRHAGVVQGGQVAVDVALVGRAERAGRVLEGGLQARRRARVIAGGQAQPAPEVVGIAVGIVRPERAVHQRRRLGGLPGHVEAPGGIGEVGHVRVGRVADGVELGQRLLAAARLQGHASEHRALVQEARSFPHGPEPHGPPCVVEGPLELAPAPKGVGDLRGEARPLGIRQRGRIDVGLADEDQLVPAAMVVEGGGHQPGDADLLGVGRIELQQRAPVLEGGLRLVADDQGLEALHEQALAVGQVLGQPGGGADGRGRVGVAIAPLTAPLQDLRLLQVSLGEGGIERGGLVETLLGLLGAPASSAGEPAHRLDVLAVGLDRLRGQPRGARCACALRRHRRAQGAEQGHAQLVHGGQQLARHAPR